MTDLSLCPVRRRSVTATEMSAILGVNPYTTSGKMLENKRNPKPIVNNHIRRGKLFEPAVLEAFLLDMGIETKRHPGGTVEKPEWRIAATPDAFVKGEKTVVECKSVLSSSFEKWYERVPIHYHVQVLVQLLVLGYRKAYIGALEAGDPKISNHRFIAWEILPHQEMYEIMVSETTRFWEAVDSGVTFRAHTLVKKKVEELLNTPTNARIIYPSLEEVERMKQLSQDIYSDLSRIQDLFK